MATRVCHICGYDQALEKQKCAACGWAANQAVREGDELAQALKWENEMIDRVVMVYPVGLAPAGSKPLDPVSLSIVLALKDSPFGDDVDRVRTAIAGKTYLMLRLAKINAGERGANAIYDFRLELAYGGENTVALGADKELLILWGHFTPIVTPK